MTGFGKTKAAQAALQDEELPAHERADPFAALQAELDTEQPMLNTHTFAGLIGHENTCKTAIVTAAYNKYWEEIGEDEQPKQLWLLDFDGGGFANKSAFYPENTGIKSFEPYVYMSGNRTAIDYDATHNRVMQIMQFAIKNSDNIWGVLVTGVDQWDAVCVNNMRINDLGLASDAISASDVRGAGDGQRVGSQWDWSIRKTRFQQLTSLCRALVKRGVKVFMETHLSLTNYSVGANEANASWKPAWEKSTNNFLFQIIRMEREDTLDEEGNVLIQRFTATFEKSKTDATLQGQKRTVLVTEVGKAPIFYGLPELNDGTL